LFEFKLRNQVRGALRVNFILNLNGMLNRVISGVD